MSKIRAANLEPRPGSGDRSIPADLTYQQIAGLTPFAGMVAKQLEARFPRGMMLLRRYQAGDTICRQGEPGNSAFYLLTADEVATLHLPGVPPITANQQSAASGDTGLKPVASVLVAQRSGPAEVRRPARLFGLLAYIRPYASQPQFARLRDRAVIAGDEREVASLYPGELCGEMACLSRTPRTATVRATAACYALELLRNVLELVQSNKKNPAFKERLEQVYRQRAIRSHILSLPLLQGVDAQVLDELARRVEYVVKQPGDVIFEEGKQSESVYLISIGQVRIVQSAPGGERFLGYNYRGDVLGEISATRGTPHSGTVIAYQHPRAGGRSKHASRVELLRLGKDDFLWLLKASPLVAQRIETIVAARTRPLGLETEDRTFGLAARFHELGLPQGQKLMVIDLERCTRCDECVRACAATHADSKTRLLREGPRFGHYLVPASCRQCRDPVCLIGCPVASIHKGPSGEIVIEDWCIGCKTCAEQCPYDAITMQDYEDPAATPAGDGEPHEHHAAAARSLAVVCDQCASLSDGVPSCVYSCPHDAALRRDVFELFPVRGPGTGRPRG